MHKKAVDFMHDCDSKTHRNVEMLCEKIAFILWKLLRISKYLQLPYKVFLCGVMEMRFIQLPKVQAVDDTKNLPYPVEKTDKYISPQFQNKSTSIMGLHIAN